MSYYDSGQRNETFFTFPKIVATCILVIVFYYVSKVNYLLFHTLAEGFAALVAFLIYILATSTYRHSKDNFLLFLGYTYVFIGVLDILHLITYKGIAIVQGYTANTPTQLWIAGRYLEAITLFLAPFFITRNFSRRLVVGVYGAITGFFVLVIMFYPLFPVCYIEGKGLTLFKILSEYIISLIILGSAYNLYKRQDKLNPNLYSVMIYSMAFFIVSELSFTLYTDVFGVMNFAGHILKLISYYLIFKGVLLKGIEEPYDTIFRELKQSTIQDYLTGLYNRQGFIEFFEHEAARAKREEYGLGLLLLDLNSFKSVNDQYGHLAGDFVLKGLAKILKASIRETDIACRLGGDEFVVLLTDADEETLCLVTERIRAAVADWDQQIPANVGVSIGSSLWQPGQEKDIDSFIREADVGMYREKGETSPHLVQGQFEFEK
ncbi:MAG: GGDEF domain-containing protein [Desulfitobacterium hafniense]|nr:GGDEF domain-containing protein [Desulfitobacterium hafniense]